MTGKTGLTPDSKQTGGSLQPLSDPWAKLARAITNATAPPFLAIPTYVILNFYDVGRDIAPNANYALGLAISICLGIIFPTAFVLYLHAKNHITDVHIPIRQQRNVPFLVTIFFYALATLLVALIGDIGALLAVLFCNTLVAIIMALINLAWKISAHATGVGGPLAALTFVYGWAIWPLFLLLPLVGWSRIKLKAHTPAQVIAGSLFGFLFTYLLLMLVFHPLGWI